MLVCSPLPPFPQGWPDRHSPSSPRGSPPCLPQEKAPAASPLIASIAAYSAEESKAVKNSLCNTKRSCMGKCETVKPNDKHPKEIKNL